MIYLVSAIVLIAAACLIYGSNNFIICSRYLFPAERAEGRIVHLSDLHSCRFTERLYEKIRKEAPDVIVITGDLWDRTKREIGRMTDFAEKLCKLGEVVYVPGNHEFHEAEHERIFDQLEKKGVHVLRHRTARFGGIQILGLDILKYGAFSDHELQRLEEREGFRLAAVHYPEYFEAVYSKYSVDLVLCGHAHGGQFRIPFLKKGIYSPGQGIFPKYSEGIHERNGVHMIVSRGIGNSRFPFRLFNCPEIVVIDIKRKEK